MNTTHPTPDTIPEPRLDDPAAQRGTRRWLRRPTRPRGWVLAVVIGAVVLIGLGNLVIVSGHLTALAIGPDDDLELEGIPRARAVDDDVWRGRAPTEEGYRALADRGVEVVVDLRAEEFEQAPVALLDELGLEFVHMPIRDGQTPTTRQVERFMEVVDEADGTVFVHCGAGVGRTGVMAAAYSSLTTEESNLALLWENLSIGPPSLEQISYALTVDGELPLEQPPVAVRGLSRLFDGPRRIWHTLRGDV